MKNNALRTNNSQETGGKGRGAKGGGNHTPKGNCIILVAAARYGGTDNSSQRNVVSVWHNGAGNKLYAV